MPSEAEIEAAVDVMLFGYFPTSELEQRVRAALFAAERVRASEQAHNSDDRTNLPPVRLEPESKTFPDLLADPIRGGKLE